jgi:hypothetical protein
MSMACLIGVRHPGGVNGDTMVRVAAGGHPDQMVPTLRTIWRWTFDGDTAAFTDRLLRHHWAYLDPNAAWTGHSKVERGLGTTARTGQDRPETGQPTDPITTDTGWLYLVDLLDEHILVFQATAGAWVPYDRHRHRLHADHDGTFSSPLPTLGDAATADQVGHHWMSATVSVDGLHVAWTAEVCSGEHGRGVTVVRFDHDTLADAIDALETFYADRLPGSGLPRLALDDDVLVTTWYPGTPHTQSQITYADAHGRFILGPHLWPWTVTNPPPATTLHNGVAPIREWVSPDGFFACHPSLHRYTLPQVCAAITDLAGTRGAAVLEPADRGGHVWLVAPSHALMITPVLRDDLAGTVLLPRPLGGSWTADEPVPMLTAEQVAAACARLSATGRPTT